MTLAVVKLTFALAQELAPKVSEPFRREVRRMGGTVEMALMRGILEATTVGCRAYAVVESEQDVVGAFGSTYNDCLWSLWAPLNREQKLQVLEETPEWVRSLLACHQRPGPLGNMVDAENRPTLDWLRRTGCFVIEEKPDMRFGTPFYHFRTVPNV